MTPTQGWVAIGLLWLILATLVSMETRTTARESLGVVLSALFTVTGAVTVIYGLAV